MLPTRFLSSRRAEDSLSQRALTISLEIAGLARHGQAAEGVRPWLVFCSDAGGAGRFQGRVRGGDFSRPPDQLPTQVYRAVLGDHHVVFDPAPAEGGELVDEAPVEGVGVGALAEGF